MIFTGPMAGSQRIIPAVAMADAFLATMVFGETKKLPDSPGPSPKQAVPRFRGATKGDVNSIPKTR
jgi:hypothetical protein